MLLIIAVTTLLALAAALMAYFVAGRLTAPAQEDESAMPQVLLWLLDSIATGVMVIGQDGKISFWNRACETIFKLDKQEMIGASPPKRLFGFGADDDVSESAEQAELLLEIMMGREIVEMKIDHYDARKNLLKLLFSGHAYFDSHKKLRGVICLFSDITDREQAQHYQDLAGRAQVISGLSALICHDFNNMLALASASLDKLERQPSVDLIAQARKAVKKSAALAGSLLGFARCGNLPMGRATVKKVNLRHLISELAQALRLILGDAIKVVCRIDPLLWDVEIEAASLESALVNLALNAKEAMGDNGVLTLKASNIVVMEGDLQTGQADKSNGSYVQIEVSDTGQGMTAEALEKAGQPYFTTKVAQKGAGLGLASVDLAARQANGFMRLYSLAGKGTSVCLYLPRKARG